MLGVAALLGCEPECRTDAACPRFCDDGQCVECRIPAHCLSGGCVEGICRGPACRTAEECPIGPFSTLACIDSECRFCRIDSDCGADRGCIDGVCGRTCVTEDDCDAGGYDPSERGSRFGCRHPLRLIIFDFCDGASPWEAEIFSTPIACRACTADADCAPGQRCRNGDCSCATTADCPPDEACVGGVCGTCRSDADCACGRHCGAGSCRPACTTDADCPSGRCQLPGGRCVQCLTDADCAAGARCYADGCVVPCPADPCSVVDCSPTGRCGTCDQHLPGPPAPSTCG
jgi:Cys-rich repeat protein